MSALELPNGLRLAFHHFQRLSRCQFINARHKPNAKLFFSSNPSYRPFSSCVRWRDQLQDFQAAPEMELESVHDHKKHLLQRIRVVPQSPSYFTSKPNFTDDFIHVQNLYQRHKKLPRTKDVPRIVWCGITEFRARMGNEDVQKTKYDTMLGMLQRMHQIDPRLMPEEVKIIIELHKASRQPVSEKPKIRLVDEMGRTRGHGRRKTSSANAYLVEGEGEVLINGKALTEAFGRLHDRESAIWALLATNRADKYNVFAVIRGGGVTGQAEAMKMAVGRALLVHEPALKPTLRKAGCLTRDPRMVERKKPGHLKARKKPAWVKR